MEITSDKRKIHQIIFSRLKKESLAFFASARKPTEMHHCQQTFVQVCSFHPKLQLFLCLSLSLSFTSTLHLDSVQKCYVCFSFQMQSKSNSEIFVQKFRHHKKGQKHSSTDIITDIHSEKKWVHSRHFGDADCLFVRLPEAI